MRPTPPRRPREDSNSDFIRRLSPPITEARRFSLPAGIMSESASCLNAKATLFFSYDLFRGLREE